MRLPHLADVMYIQMQAFQTTHMLYFSRNVHIFPSEPKVTVMCSTYPLSPSKFEENCNISGLSYPNCKQAI